MFWSICELLYGAEEWNTEPNISSIEKENTSNLLFWASEATDPLNVIACPYEEKVGPSTMEIWSSDQLAVK